VLKMLLMIQVYYNPGVYAQDYEFHTYPVLVKDKNHCERMGTDFLNTTLNNVRPSVKANIVQTGFMCTDAIQELEFWPIPDQIPIPTRK